MGWGLEDVEVVTAALAADPGTTVGVAEITQLTDSNNSRASVIFVRPDARLECSDSVRLK